MYDVISSVLNLLKIDTINNDNFVFRLHYKVTMFILVVFSLLITQRQYFGDPIDCLTAEGSVDLDTYCWIQSTFTYPNLPKGAHEGVGTPVLLSDGKPIESKHHSYYQWVTLVLMLQALMFYIPRYLWKIWEGGKLKMLIEGMHLPILDEADLEKKKSFLISFMKLNFSNQNFYAYKFFFCELLNFINIIGQIFLTDAFVNNEFTSYGTKVLSETMNTFYSRNDTLEAVFPKVTMCTFKRIGSSGSPEIIAGLCVLPLNVFTEKLYIFLWFWFIILSVISGVAIIYRSATFFPRVRQIVIRSKSKLARIEDIDRVTQKCKIGDWFFLTLIAKNMDENVFKTFISDLASEI